jgi:hypothetical protein
VREWGVEKISIFFLRPSEMKTFRSLDGAKGEKKHFYQVKEGNKKKKRSFFVGGLKKRSELIGMR